MLDRREALILTRACLLVGLEAHHTGRGNKSCSDQKEGPLGGHTLRNGKQFRDASCYISIWLRPNLDDYYLIGRLRLSLLCTSILCCVTGARGLLQ